MKISSEARSVTEKPDYNALYFEFAQKYRNVFTFHTDDEVFIYRSLSRQEYREIISDKRFNDYEKEELICDQCMLYPENYDWDNCPAGIPSELHKEILRNSYLDSIERRVNLHLYYRAEMFDLDNQITCIISEAFPQYDIEEIEQWDMEKTTKMLSRAEWKLQNFHGMQFANPKDGFYGSDRKADTSAQDAQDKDENEPAQETVPGYDKQAAPDEGKTIRGGKKSDKLTPEKIREFEEFKRRFPEFAGTQDEVMAHGAEGLSQPDVDTTPPALRPGWY